MNLTPKEIKKDIADFQDRIFRAKEKLADLPAGFLPFSEHKKRKNRRKELKDDISHFQKIIKIAMEGLNQNG